MKGHNHTKISSPLRFENLNGLRFIGAFSVFVFHCFTLGQEVWGDFFSRSWFQSLKKIFNQGHYGVNLFFVLSGFLITYLLLAEAKRSNKINVYGFFMRRLLRIWPVYFIVLIFGFLIFPHLPFGLSTINSPLYYGAFLSNFEEIWHGWKDNVNLLTITWSVSIEEQFYMAWVLLMLLIPPVRKGKGFLVYFTILIAANLVFRYYNANDERVIYFHTLSVISDIAIGGYLSCLCYYFSIQKLFSKISKWTNVLIYAIGLGGIFLISNVFRGDFVIAERLLIGLFFAYIIADQAFGINSFFKADKLPGFYNLGEISYGIYMYHCIVIYYTQVMVVELGWNGSFSGFIFFVLFSGLASFGIAWLSFHYIEKPLLTLKKYFR